MSVTINPPKTPVTQGSNGLATATIPNMCKMPGPPAPFVPTPLPNIGKSGSSPKGYSKSVKIKGKAVAIRGASFGSTGDIASKGTGGGLISSNVEGPTKFVGPGSLDVKIEGKNVHLLGDPMLNNCGPSGSPPNAATMLGVIQACGMVTAVLGDQCPLCEKEHKPLKENEKTKADARSLAQNYDTRRRMLNKKDLLYRRPTMLGVVHCKCSKKYADQSGGTSHLLCGAADDAGMKHPPAQLDFTIRQEKLKERIKAYAKNDEVFEKIWENAEELSKASEWNRTLPASYPPGACAAQGALVLALDDGGLPEAMTEQWYHSKHKPTAAPIKFIDATSPEGYWVVKDLQFSHGSTVPPCGTCEIILSLLLCFQEEEQCSH